MVVMWSPRFSSQVWIERVAIGAMVVTGFAVGSVGLTLLAEVTADGPVLTDEFNAPVAVSDDDAELVGDPAPLVVNEPEPASELEPIPETEVAPGDARDDGEQERRDRQRDNRRSPRDDRARGDVRDRA
ncbi:MAG: hypothetical protein AAGE88_25525 [Actinomycetota bacterium]